MKYKVYAITFPRELSPAEQTILVGEIKGMVEYWQSEIERILGKFDRGEMKLIAKLPGAGASLEYVKFGLRNKKIKILDYVKLGQDPKDKKKYNLCVATAEVSMINRKINLFGRNFNLKLGSLMDDQTLINNIKTITIPLIGFKKSDVWFDVKEEDMDWEKA